MKLARIFAACVLLFALAAPTTAAARWIDFGSDAPYAEPDVTVLRSGASGIALEMSMPGLEAADVATELGPFAELSIPGSPFSIEIGSPMLPVIREYIEIPQGAMPRLTIVSADYREVALSDLGIEHRIVPVQESAPKIAGAREAARFLIDDDAYARTGFSPNVAAALGETGQIRAHRFVELEIFPVQYDPASGTIRYLTGIELEVEFDGADWAATQEKLERYASPDFDAMAQHQFINADEFTSGRGVPALPIGYLIITYDDFYEEIEMFAGLRHRLGYETTVTKLSDIPGGTTPSAIQAYIIDAYNTWDTPPTFVLLVGDTPQITPFPGETGGHVSDTYFVCMDGGGEWLPDAFIGRFSCTTEAQVTHLVDKTVKYMRFALPTEDWTKKCTFMASSDNYTVSEGTHNYCIDNWVTPAGYTDINKRYSVTHSATTAQCIADINGGISMLTYSGHGSTNGWADGPPMTATQVNALTNVDMLPFVQSYACITGQFDYTCFGETWTNATNGGVLFMGASNNSYWDEDDYMEKGVYDSWFGEDITWARGMINEGLWDVYQAYSGGGRTQYYYEMYTVFGDPALDPWTDIPGDLTVSYQAALPLGQNIFPVDVADGSRAPVEGALVCLFMEGLLYETGLTDASGHVDITFSTPPQDVGPMDIWVSKHDFKPKSGTVNVIVPVTYDILPPTIPVNAVTPVVVTVWDSAGTPLPDVEITVEGWGVAPHVDVTDGLGQAQFSLMPPYGEDLTIVASELGQTYNCFEDVIPVTGGTALTSPDIDASVASIGLYGSLTPHYEGTITGSATQTGLVLFAVGCGVDATAGPSGGSTVEALVTPTSTGTIEAAVARKGHNVYLESIAVNVVYGQLTGTIDDAMSAPIAGALVKGYPAGSDTTGATPIFTDASDAMGAYDMGMDIEVGYYDVYASKFGYLTAAPEVFVQYGANVYDITLASAPSGIVSGTVTETGTGAPLEATIKVYRSDNMALYVETTSDPMTGDYAVTLPYFNYQMNVRAYHHIPENRGISVSSPAQTEDFVLDVTLANILVISDGSTKQETFKVDKAGNIIDVMPESPMKAEKSATQISTDLIALGYDVTQETVATTDPGTWLTNYDFIVSSSGDNTEAVADAAYRTALESYVAADGKLIVEGGEVAYDAVSSPGYPTFAANVLHSADWNSDSSGNLTVYDDTHPVTTSPNTIGTITFTYENYGDQDASIPTADAAIVCSWSSQTSDASVIVYDDTPNPQSGQIVFFQFDYLAGESSGVMALLENAVTYLMAQEAAPEGSISGQVCMEGEGDHAGILVTAMPGELTAYTNSTGHFTIDEVYNATYTVTATMDGWSSGVTTGVEVSGGLPTGGINMMLYPVTSYLHCSSPGLSIPDDNPSGVYDTIVFAEDLAMSGVEVYVDITHTYIGDLMIDLTSPGGTTVTLHNRSGGSADNLSGWYDAELAVDGPGALSDFAGESTMGSWTIHVSDNAGSDLGTLNDWCVRAMGGSPTGVDDELGVPVVHVLRGVSPNPFNPVTTVSYGAPSASRVRLAIYNVAGRLVRTLVDGDVDPGYHSIVWDGTDEHGVEVGSGVYFCRMEAESFEAATKMVLLK